MAAGLATPQDVRLNEPGPICQDSKKRRPFADEYACLGMRSLRARFRKSSRLGVNSGTKTEVSHGECEDQGASSDRPNARPEVSCREEAVNLQQPPKPKLHPWDTSVFGQNLVFAVYFLQEETRCLSNIRRMPKLLIYWSSCRAGLLTQLDCSTARTPQSSKENEAQILN